ncbi:MAG: limonene-1,2-epoxide hydrolase family protein [Ilumatobacteraceae bacterium]
MSPSQIVIEFIRHIEVPDLDQAIALLAPHVEYDNVPIGKVHGPDAVRAILQPFCAGFDEIDWVIHHQVSNEHQAGDASSGAIVMNERTDRFRSGERWIELPVCGVFRVNDDGLIELWRDYFDDATLRSQLSPS